MYTLHLQANAWNRFEMFSNLINMLSTVYSIFILYHILRLFRFLIALYTHLPDVDSVHV